MNGAGLAEAMNGAGLAEAKRRERAARTADTEATRRLFSTVPATLAGVLALVRYAAECDAAGDDIWMVYMTDEDEPVYGYQARFMSDDTAAKLGSGRNSEPRHSRWPMPKRFMRSSRRVAVARSSTAG